MSSYTYVGSELELFREARNWKAYYARLIRPYLGSDVLEVGAGIGGTTQILCRSQHQQWMCLEPDGDLVSVLKETAISGGLPQFCEIQQGTVTTLASDSQFDSILYIDVLEHIEEDSLEVQQAVQHLKVGGHLIVLSPAHSWLYSPFDAAIGHYRRYDKRSLSAATRHLDCVFLGYLDSVGLLASLSNRWLKRSMPTAKQIRLWDRAMVPVSTRIDGLLGYSIGKSILGVWRRPSHL
ncbi:methyltransferase type 12 [Leptolyngbya sp. NIES-3755]|nr:methyltransferase type 12 [Leptolyngbya sp. NIES-3755]